MGIFFFLASSGSTKHHPVNAHGIGTNVQIHRVTGRFQRSHVMQCSLVSLSAVGEEMRMPNEQGFKLRDLWGTHTHVGVGAPQSLKTLEEKISYSAHVLRSM